MPSLPGYHALFHLEPDWRKRHQFNSHLRLSPGDLQIAVGLADQLEDELMRRATGFGFLATALFMQLVGHLSRCYGRSRNADSRALLRIAEAITHLETHYAEEINIDELCQIADMPKRSFLRAFVSATGCTPIAYLVRLRINRAADPLNRTTQSVTDIAYEVGFNDSNYFARQFRQQRGVSPREHRSEGG